MKPAPNLKGMFAAALRWEDAVGAVAEVLFENRRLTVFAGFAAEDKAWVMVDRMREDIWDRARTAWARLTNRAPAGFPYSVDFVALTYNALLRVDLAALKRWLKETHASDTTAS